MEKTWCTKYSASIMYKPYTEGGEDEEITNTVRMEVKRLMCSIRKVKLFVYRMKMGYAGQKS